MFSLIPQRFREKLEPKFMYSPLIYQLIVSLWFQLGVAAILFTVVAISLSLPKIWRVSPPDFEPIVKISVLDMSQNWSLKRSARQLQASGDFAKASDSWQGAVAQNPGDLTALRGYFENALHLKNPEGSFASTTFSQMFWLLRLTKTNMADVELAARVCDRFGWHDIAMYMLSPIQTASLTSATEAVFIKSLFHQNRINEFWSRLEKNGSKLNDPELEWYRIAYRAGWSEEPESAKALAELQQIAPTGENTGRKGHLLLRAAAQKGKLDIYAREFNRLATINETTASDHANYWALMAASGRTNEAVRLAESFTMSPSSAADALRVAQAYLGLGLSDNARELLKRLAPQFRRSPELWLAYGNVLEKQKDWAEMRLAARTIREDDRSRDTLWGLSHFLEGRAELGEQRDAMAKVAFTKAAESSFDYSAIGVLVAKDLVRLGYPDQAIQIYRTVQSKFESNPDFWNSLFNAAYLAQDSAKILESAERAYRLTPNDPVVQNRFAASLLLNRTRPQEAIEITLKLYSRFPESISCIINHSCALMLNNRAEEARALLEKIEVRKLKPTETSAYYLALFEAYHSLKLWDLAWKARDGVADGTLFTNQREWLHEKEKEMPERVSRKA